LLLQPYNQFWTKSEKENRWKKMEPEEMAKNVDACYKVNIINEFSRCKLIKMERNVPVPVP